MIKELRKEFIGIGEVKGFLFKQIIKTYKGYIYEVKPPESRVHYEVFRHKINRRYNTVTYPSSPAFSLYAWTYSTYKEARDKFDNL
jgi:hypothetical protein